MKSRTLLFPLIVVIAVLFSACSSPSTSFRPYPGSDIFQGKGGEVSPYDGIDFWVKGEPDRKYKILGVIDENPQKHHRLPFGHLSRMFSSPDSDDDKDLTTLAQAAQKQGGDAIILVNTSQETSDDSADSGNGHHHRSPIKYMVIKYVN